MASLNDNLDPNNNFFDRFWHQISIDVGAILGAKLGPSWVQNGTQEAIQEQLAKIAKTLKKTIVFFQVLGGSGPPKLRPKSIKNR